MPYTVIIVTGDYYPRQEGRPGAARSSSKSTATPTRTPPPTGLAACSPRPDAEPGRLGSSSPTSPQSGPHGALRGRASAGEGLGQRRPRRARAAPSALWEPGFVSPPPAYDAGAGLGACHLPEWDWRHRPRRAPAGGRRRPLHRPRGAHVPPGRPRGPASVGAGRASTTPKSSGSRLGRWGDDGAGGMGRMDLPRGTHARLKRSSQHPRSMVWRRPLCATADGTHARTPRWSNPTPAPAYPCATSTQGSSSSRGSQHRRDVAHLAHG